MILYHNLTDNATEKSYISDLTIKFGIDGPVQCGNRSRKPHNAKKVSGYAHPPVFVVIVSDHLNREKPFFS